MSLDRLFGPKSARARALATDGLEPTVGAVHEILREAGDWVPDSSASGCGICKKPFTVTRRRHHCRCCGRVLCRMCSSSVAHLYTEPGARSRSSVQHRVCDLCQYLLSDQKEWYFHWRLIELLDDQDEDLVADAALAFRNSLTTDSNRQMISDIGVQKFVGLMTSRYPPIAEHVLGTLVNFTCTRNERLIHQLVRAGVVKGLAEHLLIGMQDDDPSGAASLVSSASMSSLAAEARRASDDLSSASATAAAAAAVAAATAAPNAAASAASAAAAPVPAGTSVSSAATDDADTSSSLSTSAAAAPAHAQVASMSSLPNLSESNDLTISSAASNTAAYALASTAAAAISAMRAARTGNYAHVIDIDVDRRRKCIRFLAMRLLRNISRVELSHKDIKRHRLIDILSRLMRLEREHKFLSAASAIVCNLASNTQLQLAPLMCSLGVSRELVSHLSDGDASNSVPVVSALAALAWNPTAAEEVAKQLGEEGIVLMVKLLSSTSEVMHESALVILLSLSSLPHVQERLVKIDTLQRLVAMLSSPHVRLRYHIVTIIANVASNPSCVGAVSAQVSNAKFFGLLSVPDFGLQAGVARTMCYIAEDVASRGQLTGAVAPLANAVSTASAEVQQNALRALKALAQDDAYRAELEASAALLQRLSARNSMALEPLGAIQRRLAQIASAAAPEHEAGQASAPDVSTSSGDAAGTPSTADDLALA